MSQREVLLDIIDALACTKHPPHGHPERALEAAREGLVELDRQSEIPRKADVRAAERERIARVLYEARRAFLLAEYHDHGGLPEWGAEQESVHVAVSYAEADAVLVLLPAPAAVEEALREWVQRSVAILRHEYKLLRDAAVTLTKHVAHDSGCGARCSCGAWEGMNAARSEVLRLTRGEKEAR